MWNCSACTFENAAADTACQICETPRPGGAPIPDPFPASVTSSTRPPPPPLPPAPLPQVTAQHVQAPVQQQQQRFVVTIPPGVSGGMKFRARSPYDGSLMECAVPAGFGPGMQIQVAIPFPSATAPPPPPPPTALPQLAWVCQACTLENVAAANECAACAGPRPALPSSEDEQLALALALSRAESEPGRGGGGAGGGAGGDGAGGGGLNTAGVAKRWGAGGYADASVTGGTPHSRLSSEEQEDLLISQSHVAPQYRNDPVVAAASLRVAGDARGTASTLVGLTPEEELELAMLKSYVAATLGCYPYASALCHAQLVRYPMGYMLGVPSAAASAAASASASIPLPPTLRLA